MSNYNLPVNLLKYVIVLFLLLVNTAWANDVEEDIYLHVEINPQNKVLFGKLKVTPKSKLLVNISGLDNVKLTGGNENPDRKKLHQLLQSSKLKKFVKWEKLHLEAGINYTIEYQFSLDSLAAYSDENTIVLTGAWYPHIDQLARYHLSVNLPEDFQAISEADRTSSKLVDFKRIEYHFDFPYLLDKLTLSASKNYIVKKQLYEDIQIETWFMKDNAHLADKYLEYAKNYLSMYQQMLGSYPYKRFAMVENPQQSGYSMPGYTLLGSKVIALPFIVKTSLGHEILHQWFGNSVYIDYRHGNWSEGLTSYLADHHYAELQANGISYRKQLLRKYSAYVNSENVFPVRKFLSRNNKSSSAIGYAKSAMIFHQLEQYFGKDKFILALRRFIKKNSFRQASWHDLQREFEAIDGNSLYQYFNDWLTRTDIADIAIDKKAELKIARGKLWLNFALKQQVAKGKSPYHLHLPIQINYSKARQQTRLLHLDQLQQDYSIELSEPPVSVYLDADYHIMRQLGKAEKIPDLALIMGKIKTGKEHLFVVSDNQLSTYQPFIDSLNINKNKLITHKALRFEQIKNNSLIIAGYDNFLVKMLFGKQLLPENGAGIIVKTNPYNDQQVIVLISSNNNSQSQLAARKISHYGNYSQLEFKNGKVIDKQVAHSQSGIKLYQQAETIAVKPSQTQSLDDIVAQMDGRRVMLIGEQHDRFEHHLNQLLLIKKLHQSGYKLAIGMEMFQQPYQQALDDYIAGRISESSFLTSTRYYQKWRYDYNLYKPIIDYAVEQQIPLLALNIEGEITKKVAKKGLHSLKKAEQDQLPSEMDFSDQKYRSDLEFVYSAHRDMQPEAEKSFDYFLQSQVLWDEKMAQSANAYLLKHPQHILVILAGNGHLRYHYGIPKRLQRLSNTQPLVIVQDMELEKGLADYVLYSSSIIGNLTPKIGVYLETELSISQVQIKEVSKDSVAEKAELKSGDIIVKLDGKELKTFADLKLALLYADTSKPVQVQIKRADKILSRLLDFSVEKKDKTHLSIHSKKTHHK